MSDDDSILARWSRRKRLVAAEFRKIPPTVAAETAKPVAAEPAEAPLPISLPPLDSIESASDITGFLAPNVPLELTRAALRRAWTADPAIRDFIGLSENAWDFNAPGGVPGFGSLDAEEIRRLVAGVLREDRAAPPTPE